MELSSPPESGAGGVSGLWYAPLLDPVRPMVEAAWRRLPVRDASAVPRAGLGGALVIHVARGWGTRRWQERGRVAVAVVEALNRQSRTGPPAAGEKSAWLAQDPTGLLAAVREVVRRDEALFRRVAGRLLAGDHIGDQPVPEAVLFLRGVVAAGVLAGAVPDEHHALLDRYAAGLAGILDGGSDRDDARAALAELPGCDAQERLLAALEAAEPGETVQAWVPWPLVGRGPGLEVGAGFFGRWRPRLEERLRALGSGPSDTFAAAASVVLAGGGKRVRGCVLLAAASATGADPAAALDAAAHVEWLHHVSLVLDDIMDEATLRRGAPPLHRLTSVPYTLGFSVWMLWRVFVEAPCAPAVRARLIDGAVAIADGQRDELARSGELGLSERDWYRIVGEKTARLFSCAAALGGLVAEAPARQVRALARYGQEIGLAFQLIDDLLDYTGTETVLGKRPGTDLRAGKMTLPLILLGGSADVERLFATGARGGRDDHAAILAHMEAVGVPARCRERARAHRDRAVAALAGLPDTEGKRTLVELADRLVERIT